MSAAVIAPTEERTILQKIIRIVPNERYKRETQRLRKANTNAELETTIPLEDEDWLLFLVQAMAKEAKLLAVHYNGFKNSENFSHAEHYAEKGKGTILNTTTGKKEQKESIISSMRIIQLETIKALQNGSPIPSFNRNPTTVFIYYWWNSSGIPVYSGHIFVQDHKDTDDIEALFFVSINKSLLEAEKSLSDRILDDVEEYARENGKKRIFTIPLDVMKSKLLDSRRGFSISEKDPEIYYKDLTSKPNMKMGGGSRIRWRGLKTLQNRSRSHHRTHPRRKTFRNRK